MIFVSLGHLTLYSIDTYFYALPLGTFRKHVAKGEIARDEQFCLLQQCFLHYQKVSYIRKKWLHPCCYLGSIRDTIEMPFGVKGYRKQKSICTIIIRVSLSTT